MRCNKCGFFNFDYLTECKKCGVDLTAIREGLGFSHVRPNVPFLLGPLLKEYSSFQEEHEEGLKLNLLRDVSVSKATEVEFGSELSSSQITASAPQVESVESPVDTIAPLSGISLLEPMEIELPEIVLDEDLELEFSMDLPDEIPEPISREPSPEDSLKIDETMDFDLELADVRVESEKKLQLEQISEPGDFEVITLESPVRQEKSMEIEEDEDLLELILDDDDLVFTLESEEQRSSVPTMSSTRQGNNKEFPTREDNNQLVLGLMNENLKKK